MTEKVKNSVPAGKKGLLEAGYFFNRVARLSLASCNGAAAYPYSSTLRVGDTLYIEAGLLIASEVRLWIHIRCGVQLP